MNNNAKSGSVKANLVALTVAEAVARLAQLAGLALLGRLLGPDRLAVVGFAWAINQLLLPFVQTAPDMIGTRDIARGGDVPSLLVKLTAVKIMIAVTSSCLIAIGSVLLLPDRASRWQVLAQGPLLLILALNGVWVFRGLRRFALYALVRISSSLGFLLLLYVALTIWPTSLTVPLVEIMIGVVSALLAALLLLGWRSGAEVAAQIVVACRHWRRASWSEPLYLGLGSFFAAALWSVPLLAARVFLAPTDQGLLAAAVRLIVAVSALFQLALQVFHPLLAQRYLTSREAGASLAAALVVILFVASLMGAALLALLAPWITLPLLGPQFTASSLVLAALASTLVPMAVGSVFGYALLADGRYRFFLLLNGGTAAVTLIGCLFAFALFPQPIAVIVLTPVLCLAAIASAVAARHFKLVNFSQIGWSHLSPHRLRILLSER